MQYASFKQENKVTIHLTDLDCNVKKNLIIERILDCFSKKYKGNVFGVIEVKQQNTYKYFIGPSGDLKKKKRNDWNQPNTEEKKELAKL